MPRHGLKARRLGTRPRVPLTILIIGILRQYVNKFTEIRLYQFGYELHNHLVMNDLCWCWCWCRMSRAGAGASWDWLVLVQAVAAGAGTGVFFIYIAVKNCGGWCWDFFFIYKVENDRFRRLVICG